MRCCVERMCGCVCVVVYVWFLIIIIIIITIIIIIIIAIIIAIEGSKSRGGDITPSIFFSLIHPLVQSRT